ncbi:MAG TPA: MBL fold metallo-hydrolase [Kofleriaceae bacterium]|nr:MBL fold metallo-hydrolase [Kofleriaceae bacterium]
MIELEFLGGAQTVTGSKHLVRTARATVLLECGLFQGHRSEANRRNRSLPIDVDALDAVVLSHAHLDHSGALPVLAHHGYHGPIYATPATRDLCAPMLEDAASIQEADARHIERLIARGVDLDPVVPLYDHDDVVAALGLMVGLPYHRRQQIAPGIELSFLDAGHVLGSAIVVLDIDDDGARTRLAFTGDLGRPGMPILRDPEVPERVVCLVTESTYGDRLHAPLAESQDALARVIARTAARGGKVVLPSFALERAQEVIYALGRLRARGALPALPIYVDSPLATKLTDVFRLHPDCYDREAFAMLSQGSLFEFDGLRYVTDVEDSKAIDATPGPAIVIAGSGMCEGGRVLHHLRALIGDPRNTVAIIGFQAEHTLGRRILERRPQVKIFGMMHELHAEVVEFDGFSAHADQAGLIAFAEAVRRGGPLRQVLLVHGEPPAQSALAGQLAGRGFEGVSAPAPGERVAIGGRAPRRHAARGR